jgi:hypothetical protein
MAIGTGGAVVCLVLAGLSLMNAVRGPAGTGRPGLAAPGIAEPPARSPADGGPISREASAVPVSHSVLAGGATPRVSPAAKAAHPLPMAWAMAQQLIGGRTVARYRGTGSGVRGRFRPGRAGTWGVLWSYVCRRHRGRLVIEEEHHGRFHDVEVSSAGAGGMGMAWDVADPGRHSLKIISSCRWTASIVLPRAPSRARAGG